MKNKSLLLSMLMLFTIALVYGQDLPPKHRGMHPVLKADGTVVDEAGNKLGSIKDGKVCDVSGNVIGVIAEHGDVSAANSKGIGSIQKDGSFKSHKGHVVTTEADGSVKVAGKEVAKVEAGYKNKAHGCALHCFFSEENPDATEIDQNSLPKQ